MIRHLRGKMLHDFREFIYHPMEVEEFERRWVEFKCDHKITEDDLADTETRKGKDRICGFCGCMNSGISGQQRTREGELF